MRWLSRLAVLVGVLVGVGAVPAVGVAQSAPAVVSSSTDWKLRDSLTAGPATTTFSVGTRPVVPFAGDWDADGSETSGVYSGGVLRLYNQIPPEATETQIAFGDLRGFPVAGDFDADGRDDVAIYRNGTWQIRFADDGALSTLSFGSGSWPSTVPVAGDWDGDGTDGIGTYTYSTATWSLRSTPTPASAEIAFAFGTASSSYPVVGDWDADGDDTVGVKTATTWSLNNQNDASAADVSFDYGTANDLPLTWKATRRQRCDLQLAAAGLSAPLDANYILGTPGHDNFTSQMTAANDVVCGFDGDDKIQAPNDNANALLRAGDIFLGGDDSDDVHTVDGGTFNGGDGFDGVGALFSGTFNGGDDHDHVGGMLGGTFNGGDHDDFVSNMRGGTFNGGAGSDAVFRCKSGGTTVSVEFVTTDPC